jgi:hypothetical protein
MTDLTPEQQALLVRYQLAHVAWGSDPRFVTAFAYATALDACLDAGFDPSATTDNCND